MRDHRFTIGLAKFVLYLFWCVSGNTETHPCSSKQVFLRLDHHAKDKCRAKDLLLIVTAKMVCNGMAFSVEKLQRRIGVESNETNNS